MSIVVGFATYPVADDASHPTRTFTFTVTVVAAVCDCTLITWNEPENIPLVIAPSVVTTHTVTTLLEAGPLQSSLTATSGARACDHAADECDYAYSITARLQDGTATGATLPDWIVYT
jgi:hypothetical protein